VNARIPPPCLLVLSDVRSDLNDFGHPIRRSRSVETDDLVKLITHYRAVAPAIDHWHLVVARRLHRLRRDGGARRGVDLATKRNDEKREHGLGNAVDHSRQLRLVVERHRDVFDAHAEFVADGHELTFVHGNHDLEFFWDAVKDDLKTASCIGITSSVASPKRSGSCRRARSSPGSRTTTTNGSTSSIVVDLTIH
jgi:hypothetical protein